MTHLVLAPVTSIGWRFAATTLRVTFMLGCDGLEIMSEHAKFSPR